MNEEEKNAHDVNEHEIEKENNKIESIDNEQEIKQIKENQEDPKKIEVVIGDGKLTISPVHEHLEVEKPKPKENRKIFVPEVKGEKKKP